MTRISVVAFVLLLAACGSTTANFDYGPEAAAPADAAYAIGAGDVLQITVWQNVDLTTRTTVRPDGYITIPLVGDIRAEGLRPTQLQEEITRRLTRYLTAAASVTVAVLEINSYKIYVLGQVTTPGEFRPRGAVTVLQALSLAGGLTRFAQGDQIVIVRRDRRGERRIPFSQAEVIEDGRLEENIQLRTGDTIIVP
jgi:polysaccharide export outer membrane protein